MANVNYKNVNGVVIGGIPRLGEVINGNLTLAAGVLSVTGQAGVALATDNPLWVTVPSTTAAQDITLAITTAQTLQDVNHASPQILGRWGTTASVAWGSVMPVSIGVANKDNTAANLRFFLTRNPAITTTPASTNNIGIGGTAPVTSAQENIVLFGTAANTGYDSKPCIILGSLQMTIDASAGGSATIAALTAGRDGFGKFQEGVNFAMPVAQNGATAGKYFTDGAGTAPVFTTNSPLYLISRSGQVTYIVNFDADGGTDGAAAGNLTLTAPYAGISQVFKQAAYILGATTITGGTAALASLAASSANITFLYNTVATSMDFVTNAMMSAGGRTVQTTLVYQAF